MSVVCLSLPAGATAAGLKFKQCPNSFAECARLSVPLDHSGVTAGSLSLQVKRIETSQQGHKNVLVALAGGPGQGATEIAEDFAEALNPALGSRDLVVFDQRGTGYSGPLKCAKLNTASLLQSTDAAAACAQKIGSKRAFYTTRDSVEDIESLRKALKLERLSFYGVSYGSKVAEAYALAYPTHVDRLVLDSIVLPEGPDPFYRSSFAAMKRVLGALCKNNACKEITKTPDKDLEDVVGKIAQSALKGKVVNGYGKKRKVTLGRLGLFSILLAGDFDPTLRAALPGSLQSALHGDYPPLLRLLSRAESAEAPGDNVHEFSVGLYAATTCEESPLPWSRTSPFSERIGGAKTTLDALPADTFLPFDRQTAVESDVLLLCQKWPTTATEPKLTGNQFPQAKTLILDGEQDLRTPLEDAKILAGRIPGSKLVKVPSSGHSVLSSDLSTCSVTVVENFFKNKGTSDACTQVKALLPLEPIAPLSLSALIPAKHLSGARGRTITAALQTLNDVNVGLLAATINATSDAELRGGGLRGGYYVDSGFSDSGAENITLNAVEYVPGVKLSGTLTRHGSSLTGRIKISGKAAPDGRLKLTKKRISGRLGGRSVSASVSSKALLEATIAQAASLSQRQHHLAEAKP